MTYHLGVDLGTTYTAAAIARGGRVEIVPLGDHEAAIPSVMALTRGVAPLVGEAAERRAATSPGALAREFKRRIGDPTPLILDGVPYSPHALMGILFRSVVEFVVARQGEEPAGIAVTCPANWGPHRRELLAGAIAHAGWSRVMLVSEPEAAAVRYASTDRVEPGSVVAVYDLGGGTFDAAVLRRTDIGYDLLGEATGIEQLGGVDIDEAVFAHVRAAIGPNALDLDVEDPVVIAALVALRRDCVLAKESLSHDTETAIGVSLPGTHALVRLTRGELEDMIRPLIEESVKSFGRALASSGVATRDLKAVLLAGGSSRIPLVGQVLSAEIGRPVAVDAHPKHIVALGAALRAAAADAPVAPPVPEPAAFPEPAAPIGRRRDRSRTRPGQAAVPPPRQPDAVPQQSHPVATAPPPAPPEQTAAGRRQNHGEPPPPRGGLGRRTLGWLLALGLVVAAAVFSWTGFSAAPVAGTIPPAALTLTDARGTARPVGAADRLDLDLGQGIARGGTSRGAVTVTLHLLGKDWVSSQASQNARLSLSGAQYVVAGPVAADVTLAGAGSAATATRSLLVVPTGSRLLTLPGAGAIVLLMFVLAYSESLLKPVRRNRRASAGTLFAMALLGAGGGLALAVLGWVLTDGHLLSDGLLLATAVCGAGAAIAVTSTMSTD
jgi:actin-like ATPase involved in cell morphogenesis